MKFYRVLLTILIILILPTHQYVTGQIQSGEEINAPFLPLETAGTGCTNISKLGSGKILINCYNHYQVFNTGTNSFTKLDVGTTEIYQREDDWVVTLEMFDSKLFKYTIYPSKQEYISTNGKVIFLDKSGTNVQHNKETKTLHKLDSEGRTIWIRKTGLDDGLSLDVIKLNADYLLTSTNTETWVIDLEKGTTEIALDFGVSKWSERAISEKIAILSGRVYSLPDFELITEIKDGEFFEIDDSGFSTVFTDTDSIELKYFDFDGEVIQSFSCEKEPGKVYAPTMRIGKHIAIHSQEMNRAEIMDLETGEIEKSVNYEQVDGNQYRGFIHDGSFVMYPGKVMHIYNPATSEHREVEVPTRMHEMDNGFYWFHGSNDIKIKSFENNFETSIPIDPGGYDYYEEGSGIILEKVGDNILEFTIPQQSEYCPVIHGDNVTIKIPRPIQGRLVQYENGYGLFRVMHGEYYDGEYSYHLYSFNDNKWELLKSWENTDSMYFSLDGKNKRLTVREGRQLKLIDLKTLDTALELEMAFYSSERVVHMIDELLYTNVRVFDYSGKSLYSGKRLEYLGKNGANLYFKDRNLFIIIENGESVKITKLEDDEPKAPFARDVFAPPFLYSVDGNQIQRLPYGMDYHFAMSNKILCFQKDDLINLTSKNAHYGCVTPITKFKPCPTFSIKKIESDNQNEVTFEIGATRTDGQSDRFTGEFFIVPLSNKPMITQLQEGIKINNLKPGLSKRITFSIPKNSDEVVLFVKSNGLLDVGNTELSEIDDLFRVQFDGNVTSFSKQASAVAAIWETH